MHLQARALSDKAIHLNVLDQQKQKQPSTKRKELKETIGLLEKGIDRIQKQNTSEENERASIELAYKIELADLEAQQPVTKRIES